MQTNYVVSLQLTRGQSRHRRFVLGADCHRALFRVGCAPECNWRVYGPGVSSHHLMLLWKFGELTLVDVGAGDLWLDGQSFVLTRTIVSGRIRFASAEIIVERSLDTTMPAAIDATGTDTIAKKKS